jgi:hypothetical protein
MLPRILNLEQVSGERVGPRPPAGIAAGLR